MPISLDIIGYAQEVSRVKWAGELNLVRGEADLISAQKKMELQDLNADLGYKIKPTEFVIAEKLSQILSASGLDWKNLSQSHRDLLTNLVLREPQKDLAQKIPTANALYEKLAEGDFWKKASQAEQNQALQKIADLAHLAKAGADKLNLNQALGALKMEDANLTESLLKLTEALQTADLIQKMNVLVPVGQTQNFTTTNKTEWPQNFQIPAEQREEERINAMMSSQKEKIDFGARAQLPGKVENPSQKQKTKSRSELLREAYSKAEEEARKHLEEKLKETNKNLKEEHLQHKRFANTEEESEPKKDRKGFYASLLTGGAIGWTMVAGYLLS